MSKELDFLKYLEKHISIPEHDDSNFWMIRTYQNKFFDEFVQDQYVAIGWNYITESNIGYTSEEQAKELKEFIENTYKEKRPQAVLNKCDRFINEIKVGDIAVIMGSHIIAFATLGEYYEDNTVHTTLEKEIDFFDSESDENNVLCPYKKRRKIEVIKILPIEKVSPYLLTSIQTNHHSLSSLNNSAELILSACFDVFKYDGKFTCTFRVQQEKDIDSYDYSSFVYNISKFYRMIYPNEKIIIKTNVHSAGSIIFQLIDTLVDKYIPLILIYMIIFGGKFKDIQIPSVVSVIESFLDREQNKELKKLDIESKKLDIESKKLDNTNKEYDNELKKVEVEKAKLELEKAKKSQIENISNEIQTASKNLEIKPIDTNIIDITNFRTENEDKKDGNI